MAQKPIAVLGGGNGAHMMAVDLTYRGYDVHLYEHPQFEDRFRTTLTRGAIEAVGTGPCGIFPIHLVTMDMGTAIREVEWINVVIPATGHDLFFQELAPYLHEGHKVVIWAGDFGSLRLRKIMRDVGGDKDVVIFEASTLPYGARLDAPGKINLLCVAPHVRVATLPAARLGDLFGELQSLFPCVTEEKHVLAVAFNNPNPIVHPPGALLNTGRIQYSEGDFYMYREGITEAVARVIRQVYDESASVATSLGFEMAQYRDVDFRTTASIMGVEFVAPFDTQGVIASILGPTSLKDRYLTEDLPMGLVPRSELGRLAAVPTPVIDGIVSIGSVVCQEDYWSTGRTLTSLGLAGMGPDQIIDAVQG